MNIKSLRENKPLNVVLWVGVFVLLSVMGIVQGKTSSAMAVIMLEGNGSELTIPQTMPDGSSAIGIVKTVSMFFSFVGPFLRWVILSLILAYFVRLIQEDYTELEKKEIFLLVGYASVVVLISSLVMLFKITGGETTPELSVLLAQSKIVNTIGSGVFYALLVLLVSIFEKFNAKKVLMLSSVFVALFVVLNILLPMVAPK